MASIAPRRANLTDEGEAPPPPYKLTDNESTWLDLTDLVFVDPVSAGYSRPGRQGGTRAITMASRKTLPALGILSGSIHRATRAGFPRNSSWAKATARRAPPDFLIISKTATDFTSMESSLFPRR